MASFDLQNEFRLAAGSGRSYSWDNSRILLNSPKGTFSLDLIGNELSVDQFSFSVRYNPDAGVAYSPMGASQGKKLVYRCRRDGTEQNVPEPLDECGWIWRTRHDPIIDGNTITAPESGETGEIRLCPPGRSGTIPVFRAGDQLKIRLHVHVGAYSYFYFWANPSGNRLSISGKTGLLTIINGTPTYPFLYEHVAYYDAQAADPVDGDDEITITYLEDVPASAMDYGDLRITIMRDASVTIDSFLYNDEPICGEHGEGKIYLTKAIRGKEYLTDVTYGTPCTWTVGGDPMAKGYVSQIQRTGRRSWQITCCSGVGLLDEKYHTGGIYDGAKARDVLASIIGSSFPYGVTSGVGNTLIYGWLPYDTARNNLHRLLFAIGASLTKGISVDYNVVYLSESIKTVPDSRVALGGSVKLQLPATGAEVTEHSFSYLPDSTEPVTLYDNSQGDTGVADGLIVVFPEPIYPDSLDTTGTLTVDPDNKGVNYAVVSGVGTLTGIPYIHNRTVVAVGDVTGPRVKRVTDNCLVSAANSINVARRVLSYYQSAESVSAKIKLANEKCGNNLSLTDAWGEPITAYLSKMEVSVTSVKAASIELIEGYYPGNNGNKFTHRVVISADGSWTVPEGVDLLRVVLIQGGSGGSGGFAGHNGWGGTPASDFDTQPGQLEIQDFPIYNDVHQEAGYGRSFYYADRQESVPGGAAGVPGAAGKILVTTQAVEQGNTLTFVIGAGGQGGSAGGGLGTAGGETSVSCANAAEPWEASSADGAISEVGYHDTLGNKDYALPGEAGHAGGSGGMTDKQSTQYAIYGAAGRNGEAVGSYAGGVGGSGVKRIFWARYDIYDVGSGGGGGGAAWGAKGGKGGNAVIHYDPETELPLYLWTGLGGNGANAVAPSTPSYGSGGGGGNGGGGGGSTGHGTTYFNEQGAGLQLTPGVRRRPPPHEYAPVEDPYGGGLGGTGSRGGHGGAGVAIIYY